MKNISPCFLLNYVLCAFLLVAVCTGSSGQQNRMVRVHQLYDSLKSYQIENPEIVLASAIIETGWMECADCSLGMNNLFGFRLDNGYIGFSNYSQCLVYMKKWQQAFYAPWKLKHANQNYYDFLTYVNYAQNMPDYIKNLKTLERWILQNVDADRTELAGLFLE